MALDLFGWRELRKAEEAVATAHAWRAEALLRAVHPPHGLKRRRLADVAAATAAALKAEAALAAVQAEADRP